MRELAKAVISSSWAVSLLGIKHAANLLAQRDQGQAKQEISEAFNPVINTVLGQLDSSLQGLFRAGDEFQKGLVEAAFGFGVLDPGNWGSAWFVSGAQRMFKQEDSPEGWAPVSPRA